MNELSTYLTIRPQMRRGDVVAFSGVAPISVAIEFFTASRVTHVACVQREFSLTAGDVLITQSTIENHQSGVQTEALGWTLANYGDGASALFCPLKDSIRALIDWAKFDAYIAQSTGTVKYDWRGLIKYALRAIPILGPHIFQAENEREMFCDGYLTALLEHSGVLRGFNVSKVNPQDFMEMDLFAAPQQLMGKPWTIARYSSV